MKPSNRRVDVAVLCTHPVQYFAPLYRALSKRPEIELTVYYLSQQGATAYFDAGFNAQIKWDTDLLSGYRSVFLTTAGKVPAAKFDVGTVRLLAAISRTLKRARHDVLLLHGFMGAFGLVAMESAKLAGTRIAFRSESHRWVPGAMQRQAVRRRLFARCDGFAAIGTWNRDYYLAHGVSPARIHIAPYTVDVEEIASRTAQLRLQRNELRQKLGLSAQTHVFLYVGKMYRAKGVATLLRAFSQVARNADAALILAGDGEDKGSLEGLADTLGIRSQVVFTGFINQSDLPRIYAVSDSAIQPCDYGTWGLVINEALAAKLPVIATAHMGAVGDLLTDGHSGIVVAPGDEEGLAAAMTRFLQDPSFAAAAQVTGHRAAMTWTYDYCAEKYAQCFQALTS